MKDKLKETLTNILSYLLKVERRTLLWTNPNPTASFAAQTITIPDISQYNYLEIDTNGGSAVSGFTCRYPVAELLAGNIHWATFIGQGATGLPSVNGRPFKCVSSTQIQFDNGAYWNTSGAQGGLPNVGKPLRIYGIKSGGVLRKSVIAVLSAILKIGGGVNETRFKRTLVKSGAEHSDGKLWHSQKHGHDKCGNWWSKQFVCHYTIQQNIPVTASSFYNREQSKFSELWRCSHIGYRCDDNTVSTKCTQYTALGKHEFLLGIYRTLTLSERGWAV